MREILLRDKPREMLDASPKGTVPVLVLADGGVIDESLAIMNWALDGSGGLHPPSAEMHRLIEDNDGPFKHHLDRYKYGARYEDVDALAQREAGARFIASLDARLSEGGHLFGAAPCFADYAIFPFIRQFRIADPAWFDRQDWPHLHPWLKAHMSSQLFAAVMQKFPVWKQSGEAIPFGDSC